MQDVMQRYNLLIVVILGMLACLCLTVAFADEPVLIAAYASGDRFYLEPDSIHAIGGDRLEYRVVGQFNPSAPGSMVTLNQVDCRTGLYLSWLHAWRYDASGNLMSEQNQMPHAIMLARGSGLYGALRNACQMTLSQDVDW